MCEVGTVSGKISDCHPEGPEFKNPAWLSVELDVLSGALIEPTHLLALAIVDKSRLMPVLWTVIS